MERQYHIPCNNPLRPTRVAPDKQAETEALCVVSWRTLGGASLERLTCEESGRSGRTERKVEEQESTWEEALFSGKASGHDISNAPAIAAANRSAAWHSRGSSVHFSYWTRDDAPTPQSALGAGNTTHFSSRTTIRFLKTRRIGLLSPRLVLRSPS